MKRVIFILIILFFSVFVFAEDFEIDPNPDLTNTFNDNEDAIETATLRSDLAIINSKINAIEINMISKNDINLMKDEFFLYGEGMLNYFLAQLLLMLGAVIVFFFAVTFVFKAKKWL